MIFDTHIHLNDKKILDNIDIFLSEAKNKGVKKFLCVGYDLESSKLAIKIAKNYEGVYAAIGVIPTEHRSYNEESINELKKLALNNKSKVVAIGEIGLDYYWEKEEDIKIKQKKMFVEQIELANELDLPISIHCRDAIQDTYDILKEHKVKNTGIMHCYSGSYEMAVEFIKLGFMIAFGGVLTFKNAIKTKEVLEKIPLNSVVFETDAPYLAPTPYRGKINIPEYIVEVSKYASSLLNIDRYELENIVYKNSLKILKIDE